MRVCVCTCVFMHVCLCACERDTCMCGNYVFVCVYGCVCSLHVCPCTCVCVHMRGIKLQALVYDILPSTTAVFSYAIGSRKLSANEQFSMVLKQK